MSTMLAPDHCEVDGDGDTDVVNGEDGGADDIDDRNDLDDSDEDQDDDKDDDADGDEISNTNIILSR